MPRGVLKSGFSLVELLATVSIIGVLSTLVFAASRKAYEASSLAASANNLRQLAAGAAAYLGDNDYRYWKYVEAVNTPAQMEAAGVSERGVRWWFGFETSTSSSSGEGNRTFDPLKGPLGGYVPSGMTPDPSFALTGKPMKPKYKFGYIGIGYNVFLATSNGNSMSGWTGNGTPQNHLAIQRPGEVVVFATSAQVNTFQAPASTSNPMIEEFYGIDDYNTTVHFRHGGKAMVVFANGSAGWIEMDESTRDMRDPAANIGRFAPRGSKKYLAEVAPAG